MIGCGCCDYSGYGFTTVKTALKKLSQSYCRKLIMIPTSFDPGNQCFRHEKEYGKKNCSLPGSRYVHCLRNITSSDFFRCLRIAQSSIQQYVSKQIQDCFGLVLICSVIGQKNIVPPSQPIRCKTNTNQNLVARVFPRFRQFSRFYFEFSLVLQGIFLS